MDTESSRCLFQIGVPKRKRQYDGWCTNKEERCNWIIGVMIHILAKDFPWESEKGGISFIDESVRVRTRLERSLAILKMTDRRKSERTVKNHPQISWRQTDRTSRIQRNSPTSQRNSFLGYDAKRHDQTYTEISGMLEEEGSLKDRTEWSDRSTWGDMDSDINWSYYQTIPDQGKDFDTGDPRSTFQNDISESCRWKGNGWADVTGLLRNNVKISWISEEIMKW